MIKRIIIGVIAIASLCGVMCACQPEQSELKIDTVKETAKIVGKVLYNEVYDKDGNWNSWQPASGVTVIAKINYTQYSDGAASGSYIVKATTNSEGKYTLIVPVGARNINATVSCLPFYQTKYDWSIEGKRIPVNDCLYNQSNTVNVNLFSEAIVTANINVSTLD